MNYDTVKRDPLDRTGLMKDLQWPLILGLGALALVRPLMSVVGLTDRLGTPETPLLVTLAISIVWIAVVARLRVARPVATLVSAGLAYGVFSILLSGILSPLLTGELQGPLATPFGFGVVSVLAVNAIWGAVAGVTALFVQRLAQRNEGSSAALHQPRRRSRSDALRRRSGEAP